MDDTTTASEAAAAVRSQAARASDLVAAALTRARGDRCNAIVTICADTAVREAAAIDEAIARGEDPGPLAGVPFTVKDTIAAAGVRTTAGSRFLADHVATADAACVARMRSAGAVLVGKTNCPEFALQARTNNLVFGATSHPSAPEMSPGGSSGGCAAAVASGIVPISIGGDYGGSIRYPAGCTGIYGLRPAHGAIDPGGTLPAPATGTPRQLFQTVGPLARTIDDVVLAYAVLARPSNRDAMLGAAVTRLGIVRGGWPVAEAGRQALERMAATAAGAGLDVADVDPEPFVRATGVFDAWRATDDYADLRELTAGRQIELTRHIRALLYADRSPTSRSHLAVIIEQARALERVVADLLERTPVIVLPIALVGALPIDATHTDIDGRSEPLDSLRILGPARAITLLGLPALAVPAGVDDRGLPLGVQLVSRAGHEADLFSVARTLASAP